MPTYSVEIRGRITRDIRWIEVQAATPDAAKAEVDSQYAGMYSIHAVSIVDAGKRQPLDEK